MPKSACKRKRTENGTQNAFSKFQKTRSPLERTLEACKSTGYVKFTLDRELWRLSERPLYMAPRSSGNQNSGKFRTCS